MTQLLLLLLAPCLHCLFNFFFYFAQSFSSVSPQTFWLSSEIIISKPRASLAKHRQKKKNWQNWQTFAQQQQQQPSVESNHWSTSLCLLCFTHSVVFVVFCFSSLLCRVFFAPTFLPILIGGKSESNWMLLLLLFLLLHLPSILGQRALSGALWLAALLLLLLLLLLLPSL